MNNSTERLRATMPTANNAQELQTFAFQGHAVRIEMDEHGNPLFCAKDVCNILGYANSRKAISDHCKTEGVTIRYIGVVTGKKTDGSAAIQNVEMTFINEGNLYRLIIKSNKPEAEPFESWVCDEVLPAIRKTGSYQMAGALVTDNTADFIQLMREMAQTQKQTLDLLANLTSKRKGSNTRPPLAADIEQIFSLKADGIAQAQIAQELGLSTAAVSLILRQQYRVNPDGSVNVGAAYTTA